MAALAGNTMSGSPAMAGKVSTLAPSPSKAWRSSPALFAAAALSRLSSARQASGRIHGLI